MIVHKVDTPNLNHIDLGLNSLSNYNSLTISTTNDLENILNDQFRKRILKNLSVSTYSLNNLNGDLILSGFDNLEKIIVGENSLQNLNLFKICNNEKLLTFEIGDLAFRFVNNVIIESIRTILFFMYISLIYNHLKQEISLFIKLSISPYQVYHVIQ